MTRAELSRQAHVPYSGLINGKVHLDIPASIVKNRRPIQGPLPDVPWLHRIMVVYKEVARPLLLQGEDEGYWFTTYGANGGRASQKSAIPAPIAQSLESWWLRDFGLICGSGRRSDQQRAWTGLE